MNSNYNTSPAQRWPQLVKIFSQNSHHPVINWHWFCQMPISSLINVEKFEVDLENPGGYLTAAD